MNDPLRPRLAVLLTFDRLTLAALGCYGCDRFETAAIDELASHALVLDQHFATQIPPAGGAAGTMSASVGQLAANGLKLALAYEANSQPGWPSDILAQRIDGATGPEAGIREHPLIRLAQYGVARLREGAGPGLLWLHSRGVPEPWEAPRALATEFFDEFPTLPDAARADESQWGRLWPAYGGYLQLVDAAVDAVHAAAQAIAQDYQVLFVVAAGSGSAIPGRPMAVIGDRSLMEERVHLPALLRWFDSTSMGVPHRQRTSFLTQPDDLAATVQSWLRQGDRLGGQSLEGVGQGLWAAREGLLQFSNSDDLSIRGPHGVLVTSAADWRRWLSGELDADLLPCRVFALPDDRWMQWDVSESRRDLASGLLELSRRLAADSFPNNAA